jgi:SAM-dependent methyltransferase
MVMTAGSTRNPGTAFDALADDYDGAFTATLLGRWLRAEVWNRADQCFGGYERIIEIGCGTGEDAIRLARRGHRVLATDESPRMVEIASEKAARAGCAKQIEFRCIAMDRLAGELATDSFDGCFSNFGAINCTSDLSGLLAAVDRLLKPSAALLWVVMGRHVPWEWFWFLARGDTRQALRRYADGGTEWRGIRVTYPAPRELAAALEPYFPHLRRHALGLILPPSYAAGWINRRPRIFAGLARMDRALSRVDGLAAIADHYLIEARREQAAPDV